MFKFYFHTFKILYYSYYVHFVSIRIVELTHHNIPEFGKIEGILGINNNFLT